MSETNANLEPCVGTKTSAEVFFAKAINTADTMVTYVIISHIFFVGTTQKVRKATLTLRSAGSADGSAPEPTATTLLDPSQLKRVCGSK